MFPDKLHVSSFPDRFQHYAWIAAWPTHSDFVRSRGYACLGVIRDQHFWQTDRGLLHATAVIREWNRHRIRVSAQSCLWRKKFSRRSCRELNLQPFGHKSCALTNKLFQLFLMYVATIQHLKYSGQEIKTCNLHSVFLTQL